MGSDGWQLWWLWYARDCTPYVPLVWCHHTSVVPPHHTHGGLSSLASSWEGRRLGLSSLLFNQGLLHRRAGLFSGGWC
jgi:hypothetical protein